MVHLLVGDPIEVVLLGGRDASGGALADMWEWDGTDWLQRTPATAPPARHGLGLAYDSGRGRVVLFGGLASAGSSFGDTWEWDGAGWADRSAAGPTPRWAPAMAYDSVRQRTMLYGGIPTRLGYGQSDLWSWDGTVWRAEAQPLAQPTPRAALIPTASLAPWLMI